ncbi:MAG: hypothetical protein KH441_12410 [Clostridium sp.]|nr:hypothetical protein [Clostridium sp.]
MRIRLNRLILTTGALLCLTAAPIAQTNPLGTMEVQAAELPYSIYWETQADGSWKYKLNTGGYASGWIQDEVDKNWYYMDESATMQSGVYKSNGKYYLLSELHDGHYGHMVKNGEVYQGITISASTNADDEGALTDSTLSALRDAGVNVDNVPDISGSQHISDGEITSPSPAPQPNKPSWEGKDIRDMTDQERMDAFFGGGGLGDGTGDKIHLYN